MDQGTKNKIEKLVTDHQVFNDFVYTPLSEAIIELERRQKDASLQDKISNMLHPGVPEIMRGNKLAVLGVHIATPNYEIRRFVSIVDAIEGFIPMFFEYFEDKFTDNNERKYNLGRIHYYLGRDKNGQEKKINHKIVDFDLFRGKKISSVKTLWGQNLVEFHHDLFEREYQTKVNKIFFDASEWLASCGGNAKNYYLHLLTLFVSNGILFENFLTDAKEVDFTKEIVLPAFLKIIEMTGLRPLIVALEPTDMESNHFWMCYPPETHEHVKNKLEMM